MTVVWTLQLCARLVSLLNFIFIKMSNRMTLIRDNYESSDGDGLLFTCRRKSGIRRI